MIYRPGTEHIEKLHNLQVSRLVPFVSSITDTAVIELHDDKAEFLVNDVRITATAVTSTIANGDFTTDILSWTDASTGSASTSWYDYGTGDGALDLTGDGSSSAVSSQLFGTTDTGTEHSIRIIIERAPVLVKIGTGGASSFDIFKGELKPGEHVLSFTPASAATLTFENSKKYRTLINSVAFDTGSTNLRVDTPLLVPDDEAVRTVQSADIVFCASNNSKPFQIEHRGDKSWSVVDFRADDGPFEIINTTNVTISSSILSGDTTLTASDSIFTSGHVGALFKLGSNGQRVTANVSVADAGTGSIRVAGVSLTREFVVLITGTWVATITLQRSVDDVSWDDVETYTTNQNKVYNDTFDNSIFYYRLYIKAGDYTSGSAFLSLHTASGSIEGICRVTKYTSATSVEAQVLKEFGSTDATLDWYEGSWSDAQQFPTSVELNEGRLCFSGKEEVWCSVSDSYYSFDRSIEGDSASILRTIGFGPTDPVRWIKAAGQLIIGTTGGELVLRSTSFGEILTPSTANIRKGSSQGVDDAEPIEIGNTIYFVQRSGVKMYSLDNAVDQGKFATIDANLLNESITSAGIKRLAYTVQPETRIYAVLDDGEAAVYTVDASEEVAGWSRITLGDDGIFEDVIVIPGADEDRVYFATRRNLPGLPGGTRFLEKMAKFKDSVGGTTSETLDRFFRFTSPGTTISGLTYYLDTAVVGVWADGQRRGDYVVTSNTITVEES
jgi:hypothetical protein